MPPRKKAIPKAVKKAVWDKYIGEEIGKHVCLCCEKTEITQMSFHCGHIVSEVNGGEINVNNLKPICESCNKSMGTKNLEEFKKLLISDVQEEKKPVKKTNGKKLTKENVVKASNTKDVPVQQKQVKKTNGKKLIKENVVKVSDTKDISVQQKSIMLVMVEWRQIGNSFPIELKNNGFNGVSFQTTIYFKCDKTFDQLKEEFIECTFSNLPYKLYIHDEFYKNLVLMETCSNNIDQSLTITQFVANTDRIKQEIEICGKLWLRLCVKNLEQLVFIKLDVQSSYYIFLGKTLVAEASRFIKEKSFIDILNYKYNNKPIDANKTMIDIFPGTGLSVIVINDKEKIA